MAAPNPLSGTDEDFLASDYREMLASMRPSGENLWGARTADVAASVLVPARKVRGALRLLIGYNNVGGALGSFKLVRTNPARHPRWTNCFVDSVAELEYVPSGREDGTASKVVGKAKRQQTLAVPPSGTNLRYWTNYAQAKLLVRFKPLPYSVREDDDPTFPGISAGNNEFFRNCWIETEARTETISIETQYLFTEGEGLPAGYSAPKGNPFKGEIGQIIVKPDVIVRWQRVPARYVLSGGVGLPTKLLSIMGRVNASPFFSFPRGTLLANGLKMTRNAWGLAENDEDLFEYDVEILCSFFDPDKGYTGNPAVIISTTDPNTRGHNNCPWAGAVGIPLLGAPVADANAGKWFFTTLTGVPEAPGGQGVGCVFQYREFASAFNAADNT